MRRDHVAAIAGEQHNIPQSVTHEMLDQIGQERLPADGRSGFGVASVIVPGAFPVADEDYDLGEHRVLSTMPQMRWPTAICISWM